MRPHRSWSDPHCIFKYTRFLWTDKTEEEKKNGKKLTQNFLNRHTRFIGRSCSRSQVNRWYSLSLSDSLKFLAFEPNRKPKKKKKRTNGKYMNAEWETELTEGKSEMSAHAKIYTYRIEIILEHANHKSEYVKRSCQLSENQTMKWIRIRWNVCPIFSSINVVDSFSWRKENRARNIAMHTAHTHTHTS